jgi:copper ion binding protein
VPLQPEQPGATADRDGMWSTSDVSSGLLDMCPAGSAEPAPSSSPLLASALSPPPSPPSHDHDDGAITAVGIEGMMCGHCTGKVEKALSAVSGVTGVMVDLQGKRATVTGAAPASALVAAIEMMGFVASVAEEPTVRTTSLAVQGMMCGHCTGKVEKALSAVPGVRSVVVDLPVRCVRTQQSLTPATWPPALLRPCHSPSDRPFTPRYPRSTRFQRDTPHPHFLLSLTHPSLLRPAAQASPETRPRRHW